MGTKIDHKQPQVLLRGAGLSRGEYKNIIPLFFFLKSYPISYKFKYIALLINFTYVFPRKVCL